jgi:hypothetical protein
MLLKNEGEVKAIMGCGQCNLEIEAGETKDIPEPLVQAFQMRFPRLKIVKDEPKEEPKEETKEESKEEVGEFVPKKKWERKRGRNE